MGDMGALIGREKSRFTGPNRPKVLANLDFPSKKIEIFGTIRKLLESPVEAFGNFLKLSEGNRRDGLGLTWRLDAPRGAAPSYGKPDMKDDNLKRLRAVMPSSDERSPISERALRQRRRRSYSSLLAFRSSGRIQRVPRLRPRFSRKLLISAIARRTSSISKSGVAPDRLPRRNSVLIRPIQSSNSPTMSLIEFNPAYSPNRTQP